MIEVFVALLTLVPQPVSLVELPYASTGRADYFVTSRKSTLDVRRVERFLLSTEHLLGATVPRFSFVRTATSDEVEAGCLGAPDPTVFNVGMACAGRVRAYSMHPDHDKHEIVHLVWGSVYRGYNPDSFWEEGFATLVGDRDVKQRAAKRLVRTYKNLVVAYALAPRHEWYNASAAFQQWLVQQYGMERLLTFFWITTLPDVTEAGAFAAAFGMTRDAAEAAWLADKKVRQ